MAEKAKGPVCLIVLGMAGSGKTSLVGRLSQSPRKPYIVNLDPACMEVPYPANIDIRDTVNYKDVMKQYNLGPNGAIVTSLNLFSTRFSEVVGLLEKSSNELCVLDTPGQIEVFTWSVSGTIITEALASSLPTVVVYVMDTVRSTSPSTFMANMLYACSILYKTRLPFIVAMNKTDIVSNSFAIEWMKDIDAFQEALVADESYVTNLTGSMALALEEFYENLKICGVSAMTGDGVDELYKLIDQAREEYETDYKLKWEEIKKQKQSKDLPPVPEDDLIHQQHRGVELSDIYLGHAGSDSSTDSEGEEEPYDPNRIVEGKEDKFTEAVQTKVMKKPP